MRLRYLLLTLSCVLINTQVYAKEVSCSKRQGSDKGCSKKGTQEACENTYLNYSFTKDGHSYACKWNGSTCSNGNVCSDKTCASASTYCKGRKVIEKCTNLNGGKQSDCENSAEYSNNSCYACRWSTGDQACTPGTKC